MEIRWPDRTWERVRVESGRAGRELYAHFLHHGAHVSVFPRGEEDAHYDVRW